MENRKNLRLPSLASVAGPDILSLDMTNPSEQLANLHLSSRSPTYDFRHKSSLTGMVDSNRLDRFGLTNSAPASFNSGFSLPPLPSLHSIGMHRLRKYSDGSTLYSSLSSVPYSLSSAAPPGFSAVLDPLPPPASLNRLSGYTTPCISPYGTLPALSTLDSTEGYQSRTQYASPLLTSRRSNHSLSDRTHAFASGSPEAGSQHSARMPLQSSHGGSSLQPNNRHTLSHLDLQREGSQPHASLSLGNLPPLHADFSSRYSLSPLNSEFMHDVGIATLPAPSSQQISTASQIATGHLVLSSDYRLVKVSANALLWLGLATSTSQSVTRTAMGNLAGCLLSSLVSPCDQALYSEYLAELHAERVKAESAKSHSRAEGGDGSARGVSITINFTTSYSEAKPFVLTIWPVTRRIQGCKQAVLTGEIVPAFVQIPTSTNSVTPL